MEDTAPIRLAVKFTVEGVASRSWPAGGSGGNISGKYVLRNSVGAYRRRIGTREWIRGTRCALGAIWK
jgi:hypothetical protein